MKHEIFISYSTADAEVAREVEACLRKAGFTCFIAEKNIDVGQPFPEEILKAIDGARCMVLIASERFDASRHCRKEVIIGHDRGLCLLPVRVSEFTPTGFLRYFLCDCQWLDIAGKTLAEKRDILIKAAEEAAKPREPDPSKPRGVSVDGLSSARSMGAGSKGVRPRLTIDRPMLGKQRVDPAKLQPSVLLRAYNAFIPLIGRDRELSDLHAFLAAPGRFRWTVRYGDGGMGKTRLAIALAEESFEKEWHAGFMSSGDLAVFVRSGAYPTWEPGVPTLIIVDYAASKVPDLKRLFDRLAALEADHANEDGVETPAPVRVLLLERHAQDDKGWLEDLLSTGEGALRDLIQDPCYRGAVQLLPPGLDPMNKARRSDDYHRIITQAFSRWSALTGGGLIALSALDERAWEQVHRNTGGRPLYLQMAALHACSIGSAEGLPQWGRSQILQKAVQREREYVKKECPEVEDMRKALEIVSAMLCLTGMGVTRKADWMVLLGQVLHAAGVPTIAPLVLEGKRSGIFHGGCGDEEEETGLIQPDIVSEGYAATVLGSAPNPTVELLRWVVRLAGSKAWANLVRMVQDLQSLQGFENIHTWLPPLLEDRPLSELRHLLQIIPERSITLRQFSLAVAQQVLEAAERERVAVRAEDMIELGIRRHYSDQESLDVQQQVVADLRAAIGILDQEGWDRSDSQKRRDYAKAHRYLSDAYGIIEKELITLARRAVDPQRSPLLELAQEALDNGLAAIWKAVQAASDPNRRDEGPEEFLNAHAVSNLPVPVGDDLRIELASALNNLADELRAHKAIEPSLAAIERAVSIGEDLANKDYRRYAPHLARFYNNKGKTQLANAALDEAALSLERSRVIREEFAHTNPDEYGGPLTKTLLALIDLAEHLGDVATVNALRVDLLNTYEELSAGQPTLYDSEMAELKAQLTEVPETTMSREYSNEHRSAATFEDRSKLIRSIYGSDERKGKAFYGLALEMRAAQRVQEACKAARDAMAFFRKDIEKVGEFADLIEYAGARTNLAAALAVLGDWSNDSGPLEEGERIATEVIQRIVDEGKGATSQSAAMWNNLGHAQFRRGAIIASSDLIKKGIASLERSKSEYAQLGSDPHGADDLIGQAEEALATLELNNGMGK